MAMTPLSSATAYCTVVQLFKRYDARTLGDLILDAGQRATTQDMLDPTTVAGTNLAALLLEATGIFESSMIVGLRYQPDDVAALIASGPNAGSEFIAGIVAGITVWLAFERRPDRQKELPGKATMAMEQLEMLKNGERILPFAEAAKAGLPDDGGDNISDVEIRNGTTYQVDRYLGRRSNRVPPQDV